MGQRGSTTMGLWWLGSCKLAWRKKEANGEVVRRETQAQRKMKCRRKKENKKSSVNTKY